MRYLPVSFVLFFFTVLFYQCEDRTHAQGEVLYQYYCANCHMDDGTGLRGNIPPLANADYIKTDPVRMACIIRNGLVGEIVVNGKSYNNPMAGYPELNQYQIANIINYINQAWGNDFGFSNPREIEAALRGCTKEWVVFKGKNCLDVVRYCLDVVRRCLYW